MPSTKRIPMLTGGLSVARADSPTADVTNNPTDTIPTQYQNIWRDLVSSNLNTPVSTVSIYADVDVAPNANVRDSSLIMQPNLNTLLDTPIDYRLRTVLPPIQAESEYTARDLIAYILEGISNFYNEHGLPDGRQDGAWTIVVDINNAELEIESYNPRFENHTIDDQTITSSSGYFSHFYNGVEYRQYIHKNASGEVVRLDPWIEYEGA